MKEVSVRRIWAVAGTPQSASSFGIGISMIVCASMRTLAAALAGSGKLCLRWACLPPVGTRNAYEKSASILQRTSRTGLRGKFACYGGKTHTAQEARVRHARDARLEAGRVQWSG